HYIKGFSHADGKFRFKPDWRGQRAPTRPPESMGLMGPVDTLPTFPDYWASVEAVDAAHPYRLATPPARNYLNSSFAETKTSREKEGRPEAMIAPEDAARLEIATGDIVTIGNARGAVRIHARVTDLTKPGVIIAEGLWPNRAHLDGEGINTLTSAEAAAPYGGVGLHDNHVWLRK
ncbi:MAG: molybdopterin oxidoreductase family protein, partial [Sphingomonadales bacterium]